LGLQSHFDERREGMLWLILGIVLLVIAIAGGAIVHPILFVLAILALVMFVSGWRGRATY
jgi:membrane protein implicated in regulation of membrane protease activity